MAVNNKVVTELSNKKLFVLDMDGTFYLGDRLLEGSIDFLHRLEEMGISYLFFTNNSSKTADFYINKLHGMGCSVREGQVVTSGDVTIRYLQKNHPEDRIYLLGTGLLKESFLKAGIKLVDKDPDLVVVAFDTRFTYNDISRACTYIRNGALFLSTHPDLNCPTEDGFIPDCGALCAMITASTGIKPKYLGKPYRETIDMITGLTGMANKDIAFVGDRLYTDIAIGVRNGVTAVLVLSGETKIADLENSEIKPDYIFESLLELGRLI